MKFAFRHVPFSPAQCEELTAIAAAAGHETKWLGPEVPEVSTLADCEALMGYFPPDKMKELPLLRWVQTPAAGVEKLCGDIYANPDVVLTNCSGAFGVAIAEYMLTGLLMLMRNMPAYLENQHQHLWKCIGTCGSIYGSTITVVGMGDIGTRFAERAKAMGAHIRGVRRNVNGENPACYDEVYATAQLADAVRDVDAVVMCLPGTAATTKVINTEVFAAMSPRTIVVNCGRGYTVDQDAMIAALQEGRIAGAVLDVAAVEPMPADCPLWDMPNVIVTPHISGHDDDPVNIQFMYAIFKENMQRFIAGEPLTHVVNRSRGY